MADRAPELTRRQLLGVVAGTGAVGATTGVTVASFRDRESVSGTMRAGELSIRVDCDSEHCFAAGDGTLGFAFGDLEPGDGGRETFEFAVVDNPARLWIRTACPPAVDPLGEALAVRLDLTRGDASERLFSGTLNELRTEFSDGIRLDDRIGGPCLPADDALGLVFEYDLPGDAEWTAALRSELVFELFAEQCRHVSDAEGGAREPFESADCPELECPDCVPLGKFELEGKQLLEPYTAYAFDELYGEFADDGHAYELGVLTVTNKADESEKAETVCARVRLLRDGDERGAPAICRVAVAGGPNPENRGPAEETYSVEPPLTRTREPGCTVDEAYGISHLTVSVCADDGGDDS